MSFTHYKIIIVAAIMLIVSACGRNISEPQQAEVFVMPTVIPPAPIPPTVLGKNSVEENPSGRTILNLKLSYLNRFDINYKANGLKEPSGLVLSANRGGLWVVDDSAGKIFRLTLQGGLQQNQTISIPATGFEGATLDPTGAYLFVVVEDLNAVIQIDLASGAIVEQRRVAEMVGYDMAANAFAQGGKNKGLEGITWDSDRDRLFVLKEGKPGMMLELSTDLTTIHAHRLLGAQNGFVDDTVSGDDLDYSGLFYDAKRGLFWIVSDKGQRVFLYDWEADKVMASFALIYNHNGSEREIEKAEGIAIDPIAERLYIVSDAEARLYIFDIQ